MFFVQWRSSENRAVYEVTWNIILQPRRPRVTIRRMRISCWITEATDTCSEYVIYRVIQKDELIWTVNRALTHGRRLVAVFQSSLLALRFDLACATLKNSLEFVSRSPLINPVGRSFCLYSDSLFAQIGDSNDKCSCLLGGWIVETKTKRTLRGSWRLSFNELTNAKKSCVAQWPFCSELALLHGCALGERSSGEIWKIRISSFKCYVYHSRIMYSSGNIDIRNWVHLFESHCVSIIFLVCCRYWKWKWKRQTFDILCFHCVCVCVCPFPAWRLHQRSGSDH